MSKHPRAPADEAELKLRRELHCQGYSTMEIAARVGRNRTTIYEWRLREGLKPNGKKKRRGDGEKDRPLSSGERLLIVAGRHEFLQEIRELAQEHGRDPEFVRQVLAEADRDYPQIVATYKAKGSRKRERERRSAIG